MITPTGRMFMGRRRVMAAAAMAAALALTLGSGCTLLENLRPDGGGEELSAMAAGRRARMEKLETAAARLTPVQLGEARATVEEMEYFAGRGDKQQVKRLDIRAGEVMDAIESSTKVKGSSDKSYRELAAERDDLAARVKTLTREKEQLENDIQALQASGEADIRALNDRLNTTRAAREEAIREVVRTRSRLQGLASKAEAAAMFAEARVLVDRMDEEAYSRSAREILDQAQSYVDSGKKELDNGNPGGAAYLFDLVSSQYQLFTKVETRTMFTHKNGALLRREPNKSSKVVKKLYRGSRLKGIRKQGNWIRVEASGRLEGWIHSGDVY